MTTQPHGGTDPSGSTPNLPPTSTPIGDDLEQESGLNTGLDVPRGTVTPGPRESGSSAKDTAKDAVNSASDNASNVADTAKTEATQVASEAKDKAADLFADAKTQADEQSKTQLNNLAAKLGELADEIEQMATGTDNQGTAAGVARQLADKTHELSSHLQSREPLDLLDDVRSFARRRPAAFLAGAAVAGVVAGRLTRGAKATDSVDVSSTSTGTTAPAPTAPSSTVEPHLVPTDQTPGTRL